MRSHATTRGLERATHRALYYSMGILPEELDKPLVAIVNPQNETMPGHIHLDIPAGRLMLEVNDAELARRRETWTRPPSKAVPGSYLERYSKLVTSAMTGAVFSRE